MKSKQECLLGIDLGTGGCKLTLLDREGRILGTHFNEYRTHYPRHGWTEQDPEDWYRTFVVTLKHLFQATGCSGADLAAMAVDASTHNAVLLGRDGNVLRPCIMWTDQRSIQQVRELEERIGKEIFEITYNKVNPTWTLPQLRWVSENEPEVTARVERVFFTKDYLRYRLTGTWETDHIDAHGSMLFDGEKREWSRELIREVNLPMTAFPPVVPPITVSGKILSRAAAETGLTEGTPVVVGTSDTAAEDYGAGAIWPGQGIIKMATAGNVVVMSDRPHPTPRGFNYPHVVDGLWYILAATNSCASANRWVRDTLCRWETEKAGKEGGSAFRIMDEEAAKAPPGSDGLFFHPYLLGERSPYFDPYLRASFVGATMSHQKGHFLRAVLEGIAYSLRDCLHVLSDAGLNLQDVRLIGGGAKSPLWRQIIADVMGMPVMVPKGGDASFGAALIAGVGIGLFRDARSAVTQCLQFEDSITPDPENQKRYQRYFSIYKKIHDQLAPIGPLIHETAKEAAGG